MAGSEQVAGQDVGISDTGYLRNSVYAKVLCFSARCMSIDNGSKQHEMRTKGAEVKAVKKAASKGATLRMRVDQRALRETTWQCADGRLLHHCMDRAAVNNDLHIAACALSYFHTPTFSVRPLSLPSSL